MPLLRNPPSWVLPLADFDLDFANNRYWGGEVIWGAGSTHKGLIDGQSTSGGYTPDIRGVLFNRTANKPRITEGCGMWAEQLRTNSCLQSNTLANATWTKTNVTATASVAGPDNASNSATRLTATAANGTVTQAITLASAASVFSCWMRRQTGSGTINMTQDGGSTWVDVTSRIKANGAWGLVFIPTQTLANPTVGFRIVTNGDAIDVAFCQQESGTYPTTPLITTTAAANRVNEEPMINSGTGNDNDGLRIIKNILVYGGPWAVYGEYAGTPPGGAGWLLSSDGTMVAKGGCDGSVFTFIGGATANNGNAGTGDYTNLPINKVAGRVNGAGSNCVMNGGAISTTATGTNDKPVPPSTIFTHMGVGNNGAGNNGGPVNGYVRRLAFWRRDMDMNILQDLTR